PRPDRRVLHGDRPRAGLRSLDRRGLRARAALRAQDAVLLRIRLLPRALWRRAASRRVHAARRGHRDRAARASRALVRETAPDARVLSRAVQGWGPLAGGADS